MKQIILSICIPTYNRAQYICEAIESVLVQITPDIKDKIEICISDNASTDDTEVIVNNYKNKDICNIVYHKNTENIGADRNFLKVIEIANGKYCWWLGSDDALETNILKNLLSIVTNTQNDFYLLTQNCYDITLTRRQKCNQHELLNKKDGVLNINDLMNKSIYLLGFLSVLIVKKDIFIQKMPLDEKYIGSMYIHTYKILYAINNGSTMYFIREPMIKWRADNDSFLEDLKVYGRIKIDINGYSSIASDVFGNYSENYKNIIKIRIVNNMIRFMFLLKIANVPPKDIVELFEPIKIFEKEYIKMLLLAYSPRFIYKFSKYLYRNVFKSIKIKITNKVIKK